MKPKNYNLSVNDMLLAIGRTGVILEDNMKVHFNVCRNTKVLLIENKLIEKVKLYNSKCGIRNYYKLTKSGYKYVKQELGLVYVYRTSLYQVLHDLKLNEFYCSLDYKIRNSWLTETELHLRVLNTTHGDSAAIGSIDGAFTDRNELIGVEVITRNYNSTEIQHKRAVAEYIGCNKLLLIKL